jgi:hypothetical protein
MRFAILLILCTSAFAQGPVPGPIVGGGGGGASGGGDVTTTGTNTMSGWSIFTTGRWSPPTATFASPPTSPQSGQVFLFTDASSLGTCSGSGSSFAFCRYNGSSYAAITAAGGGGGSSYSSLTQDSNGALVPTKAIASAAASACSLASTTLTCDLSASNVFQFTMTGDWTLAITNAIPGTYWFTPIQDGTGGRVLTLPASFLNPVTVSPIAGVFTVLGCVYDGSHFLCSAASSSETAGIMRFPLRTAPLAAPGSNSAECWGDSGASNFNCYFGTSTATLYSLPKVTTATSSQWLRSLDAGGTFAKSQPAFSDLSGNATVAQGGTGLTTTTAYGVMVAGTTSTGNMQQVSGTGTSGQVLTSAGPGAVPAWQNASSGNTLSTAGIGWLTPITDCAYCVAGSTESAGTIIIHQFVPSTSINLKTVGWLNGVNTGSLLVTAGIYSDSSGACGTLLGQSDTPSGNVASGNKVEATFASTVNLTAGTAYWLAIGGNNTFGAFENGTNSTSGGTAGWPALINQAAHPRSGRVASALTGTTMPNSCGTLSTGAVHSPFVVLWP